MNTVAPPSDTAASVGRAAIQQIRRALAEHPCVLLHGSREVGKTHIARRLEREEGWQFADLASLNEPEVGELIATIRRGLSGGLVLDNAHCAPSVLSELKVALQSSYVAPRGDIVLTANDATEVGIVRKIMGTAAISITLEPIGLSEVVSGVEQRSSTSASLLGNTEPVVRSGEIERHDQLWIRGGYPSSFLASSDRRSFDWRNRYLDAVCSSDEFQRVDALLMGDHAMRSLLEMLAANQGQLPFKGMSQSQRHCINRLVDAGLVRELRPWDNNSGKRLSRAPKIYIRDTGLLHCLLGRRSMSQLVSDPSVIGHSWETFCIENLIAAAGPYARASYYRDNDQHEIDLVLESDGFGTIAAEFKLGSNRPSAGFFRAHPILGATTRLVVRREAMSDALDYRNVTLAEGIVAVRELAGNL